MTPPPGHEDLIQRLGVALLDLVPEAGWRRIDLVSTVRAHVLTVIMDDGSRPPVQPPQELDAIMAELRTLLYEPEHGAWLSARFSVDPPGAIFFNYNFDYEPGAVPPVDVADYAEDLREFPRAAENVPGWLRDRLAHGGEQK